MNKCENFKKIANSLVGEKAVLYAYLPGFSWLEVSVKKKDKVIILVFKDVIRAKTMTEWIFNEIELEKMDNGFFRIYDDYEFEIVCYVFGILEELKN